MNINYKAILLYGSLLIGGGGVFVNKFAQATKENDARIKELVKINNPEKYKTIITSKDSTNSAVWRKALDEINDSLKKLNSKAEYAYFNANQNIKKQSSNIIKVVK
ncbi:hypothetical protein J6G99_05510 [bacterium]|nr:hypothetical protein [bacterium]